VSPHHVEGVAWLVLATNSKGNQGGHVSGEVVFATCVSSAARSEMQGGPASVLVRIFLLFSEV
jgi:hypothetical protein